MQKLYIVINKDVRCKIITYFLDTVSFTTKAVGLVVVIMHIKCVQNAKPQVSYPYLKLKSSNHGHAFTQVKSEGTNCRAAKNNDIPIDNG